MHARRTALECRIQPHRTRPGSQQQRAVGKLRPVVETNAASLGIERRDLRPPTKLDAVLLIEFRRMERDPLLLRGARQIVLGEIGPVVGRVRIRVHDRDRARVALAAERLRGTVAGRATAHDDHPIRRAAPLGRRLGRRALGAHEHPSAPLLDLPGRKVVQRRRPERLPRAEAETGVVPGAAYRVAHQQAFRQRAAVMAAGGRQWRTIRSTSREQHRLAIDMPGQHAAVRDVSLRDALLQIRARRPLLFGRHVTLLMRRFPVRTVTPYPVGDRFRRARPLDRPPAGRILGLPPGPPRPGVPHARDPRARFGHRTAPLPGRGFGRRRSGRFVAGGSGSDGSGSARRGPARGRPVQGQAGRRQPRRQRGSTGRTSPWPT